MAVRSSASVAAAAATQMPHRGDRIEALPAGGGDPDAGEEHGDRAAQVGEQVQAGGPHGQAAVVVGAAEQQGDADRCSRRCRRCRTATRRRRRPRRGRRGGRSTPIASQARIPAAATPTAGRRGRRPGPNRRIAGRWGPAGQEGGGEGDQQSEGVGALVGGVGQHRDRADGETADDLGDPEPAVEDGGCRQPARRGRRRVVVAVTVVAHRATTRRGPRRGSGGRTARRRARSGRPSARRRPCLAAASPRRRPRPCRPTCSRSGTRPS